MLASFFIILVSIFLLRPYLKFTGVVRSKYAWQFATGFFVLILLISTSTHLVDKLFTSMSTITIFTRLEFWKISIEQFGTNPLVGIGFHLQEILGGLEIEKGVYYPHNYLFESLAIGGVLMTLPLLYFIFSAIVNFYRNFKIDPTVLPSGLMAAQALAYSMHNGHLGVIFSGWL